MKVILLLLCLVMAVTVGFFIMKKVDDFLEKGISVDEEETREKENVPEKKA